MKKSPPRTLTTRFCRNIYERRIKLKLSQSDIATRLGVSRAYIADLERGRNSQHGPTLSQVERVAEALAIDPLKLLRGIRRKKSEPAVD